MQGKSPGDVRDVEAVLEAFAAERLLILAAGTVEMSRITADPPLRGAQIMMACLGRTS